MKNKAERLKIIYWLIWMYNNQCNKSVINMELIKSNLKLIKKWRWILVFSLLIGSSFEAYSSIITNGAQPTFNELVITQIDKFTTLSFYFIFLILIYDVGVKRDQELIPYRIIIFISILCFSYVVMIIISNLITLILISGDINISNEIITINSIRLLPYIAMSISLLLFFFRFVFISSVVYVINWRCKEISFGFLGGLAICILDGIIYSFGFENIYGIFPFGHSNLESALRYSTSLLIDTIINILYWIVLIAIVGFVMYLLNRSKKNKKGSALFETSHLH